MRPYGRAKFVRDCARFGFLNEKMHNLPLFYIFGSLLKKCCCFLALFVCAKLLNQNIGRAKQIVFRKSAQRLTLSREKSAVIHVGPKSKCKTQCPKLNVHNSEMKEADSIKYLGNIVTTNGGNADTIEDRRNKGWGKVATILGILSEVDMGSRRVEVGLLLRKTILVSSLLFTAETWSGIKEDQIKRLEHVDQSLLRSFLHSH